MQKWRKDVGNKNIIFSKRKGKGEELPKEIFARSSDNLYTIKKMSIIKYIFGWQSEKHKQIFI